MGLRKKALELRDKAGDFFYGLARSAFRKRFEQEILTSSVYTALESRVGELIGKLAKERDLRENAEQRLGESEEARQALDRKYTGLVGGIASVRKRVQAAVQTIREVRTGKEAMEARLRSNELGNRAFIDWTRTTEAFLVARAEHHRDVATAIRGCAFGVAVDNVIKLDRRATKIPFIYYDSVNKTFTCTPAAYKFLEISPEELGNTSFPRVLRKLRREDLGSIREQEGVLWALRSGQKMSHKKVYTTGDEPKELLLTTYPVGYTDPVDRKYLYVGIGILLYDPRFAVKNRGFVKTLDRIFEKTAARTSEIIGKLVPKPTPRVIYNP